LFGNFFDWGKKTKEGHRKSTGVGSSIRNIKEKAK